MIVKIVDQDIIVCKMETHQYIVLRDTIALDIWILLNALCILTIIKEGCQILMVALIVLPDIIVTLQQLAIMKIIHVLKVTIVLMSLPKLLLYAQRVPTTV